MLFIVPIVPDSSDHNLNFYYDLYIPHFQASLAFVDRVMMVLLLFNLSILPAPPIVALYPIALEIAVLLGFPPCVPNHLHVAPIMVS